MKPRGWAAPLAVLALVLVSGCGQLTPGTAATVDGKRITMDQVDGLVEAQCTAADLAAKGGNSSPLPISYVRQQSLGLLIDTALSDEFGADQNLTPDPVVVEGFYAQFEPGITPLPAKARDALVPAFKAWARGRAILVAAGAAQTGQKPDPNNAEQLINAGLTEREKWLPKVKVVTDSRFSPAKNGFPGGGDGSVSRASSAFAKGSGGRQPDPAWVGGLPASQKCG